MASKRIPSGDDKEASTKTVRASVSFPDDQYAELERIARQQRVSLAWVVRDAVSEYLGARWPLLESGRKNPPDEKPGG